MSKDTSRDDKEQLKVFFDMSSVNWEELIEMYDHEVVCNYLYKKK